MKMRWKKLKEEILGEKYELSLVEADSKLIKKLNTVYRDKPKTTNVLSFSLSKTEGEIYINIALADKEAQKLNWPIEEYQDYLIIHSLLHLKGYDHGEKMEKQERKFMLKFNIG